ncbi:hypothetical protein QU709_08305 [Streptomyces sp. SX92]|nr:hypothetical protein QU709_08305 [Streptomyces coralus]
MPVDQTVAAIDHVLASAFYGARQRLKGVRLVATDADWSTDGSRGRSRGQGPSPSSSDEVRGPLGDLLLLATGRPAGLTGVSGPGAERLTAVLS